MMATLLAPPAAAIGRVWLPPASWARPLRRPASCGVLGVGEIDRRMAQLRPAWIPGRSATLLRKADLNVLSKLGNQGLE
jgi:hypothetical protein